MSLPHCLSACLSAGRPSFYNASFISVSLNVAVFRFSYHLSLSLSVCLAFATGTTSDNTFLWDTAVIAHSTVSFAPHLVVVAMRLDDDVDLVGEKKSLQAPAQDGRLRLAVLVLRKVHIISFSREYYLNASSSSRSKVFYKSSAIYQ